MFELDYQTSQGCIRVRPIAWPLILQSKTLIAVWNTETAFGRHEIELGFIEWTVWISFEVVEDAKIVKRKVKFK